MGTTKELGEGLRKVSKDDTFSAVDVKKMLGVDDREIRTLCKKGSISLKKDVHTDRTFFLKDDVEMLKKLKELHSRTAEVEARKNLRKIADRLSEKQASRSERSLKAGESRPIKMLAKAKDVSPASVEATQETDKEVKMLMKNLVASQENVVKRITKVLDEKLDGMDEIVIELIRCKTENEKLQQQVNSLTKENYTLKNRAASYKPVGFGLYLKKQEDSIYL